MVVKNNIQAMNSCRHLKNNHQKLSVNLEKLSSGYKINRAGDDAAGLAISEKMRAQITGLGSAIENCENGVSLIKISEAALQEVNDMIHRLRELAIQSANGTFDDEVDRNALQNEADQILEEIDRIADTTNFNGIFTLNGGSNSENGEYVPSLSDGIGIDKVVMGGVEVDLGSLMDCESIITSSINVNDLYESIDKPESSTSAKIGIFSFSFLDENGNNVTVETKYEPTIVLPPVASELCVWMNEALLLDNHTNLRVIASGDEIYFTYLDDTQFPSDSTIIINNENVLETKVSDLTYERFSLENFEYGDTITVDGVTYLFADANDSSPIPEGIVPV